MYLIHLQSTKQWAFVYGSKPFTPYQLDASLPETYPTRADAVLAANLCSLEVDETGYTFDPDPLPADGELEPRNVILGLQGLLQLIATRSDVPKGLMQLIEENHRWLAAEAFLAKEKTSA